MNTDLHRHDRELTADRHESKFLVAAAIVPPLTAALDASYSRHAHEETALEQARDGASGDARGLVDPAIQHFITTVYFDTVERDVYRANLSSNTATKLRAREYYQLHPALAELATSAGQAITDTSTLWLELKHKDADRTRKTRFGVPKHEVSTLFERGEIAEGTVAIQSALHGEAAPKVLARLERLVSQYESPLRPDCVVNYRRVAWQSESAAIRVTLDSELRCYRPREGLWTDRRALTRSALGKPAHIQREAVLELKFRGAFSPELAALVRNFGLEDAVASDERRYSKFLTASRAVHGN